MFWPDPSYKFQPTEEIGLNNSFFSNASYIAEEFVSGERSLLKTGKGNNQVVTTRISGRTCEYYDITNNLPHMKRIDFYAHIGDSILDGVLVGRTEAILQSVMDAGPLRAEEIQDQEGFLNFIVFDILKFKSVDLRDFPLHERKIYLEKAVFDIQATSPHIKMTDIVVGDKAKFFEYLCAQKSAGVVLKNKDAKYSSGKLGNYLLVKNKQIQSHVNVTLTPAWHTLYKAIKDHDFDRAFDFSRYLAVNDLNKLNLGETD